MQTTTQTNVYQKIKNSKAINFINNIFSSPWGIAIIGAVSLLCYLLEIETVLYVFVAFLVVYMCLFANDFLILMPIFVFCYISPSTKNNPGISTQSMFYGAGGIIIACVVVIAIISVLLRIGFDKNMGYKKLFTQKRSLIIGMCLLGIAYLISGIFSKNYAEIAGRNLVFALLQFISVILLYFIFTATIDWKNVRKDYFAWLGVIMGIVVCLQVVNIYITAGVIQNGVINRSKIFTGWGIYNNIGALVSMSIPFAFYLACKKKHSYIYLILATILLIGLIFTCSRGSIVGGVFIYIFSFIVTFIKAEDKKVFRISCAVLIGLAIVLGLIFYKEIAELFAKVPTIIKNTQDNSIAFNDSSRFKLYEKGFYSFLHNPIFGESFYPTEFVPYGYSKVEAFSNFFPPRWHNTIIQILSSCGIVGMLAYAFHRFQTIKLIFKNPNTEKSFIGLSILALLLMSLLDCHFFNIGPVLIYSMALAFAENIGKNKQPKTEENLEEKPKENLKEK